MSEKTYIAIDLKSFYASVECRERCLDPLTTNLVVADESRTEKTICLAVTPSLKAYGIAGRARLFEVIQKVQTINEQRRRMTKSKQLIGSSYNDLELKANPTMALDYIVAPPQMATYMKISSEIFQIYMEKISPQDIHVYSIDEVFIDATTYLEQNHCTAEELTYQLVKAVLDKTGITATAGIGPNLYLCKIAMDVEAKHMKPDANGVRIARLDERTYREKYWDHQPITDFWRIGKGIAKRLENYQIYTLGDICRCSIGKSDDLRNEDLLYKLLGVNAELLIDHAWGYESTTIEDIHNYKVGAKSINSGQVLMEPYPYDKAKIIIREMSELLGLDLMSKQVATNQLVLTLGYDKSNVTKDYKGKTKADYYGQVVPEHAHGTINLENYTCSTKIITQKAIELFERIVNPDLTIRRVNITANQLQPTVDSEYISDQYSLFDEMNIEQAEKNKKDMQQQKAIHEIQRKYGKNKLLKGCSLEEGATTMERNNQVGGHRA